MKIPARIVIPVTAAILLTGGVLAYAWWQLSETQQQLQQRMRTFAGQQEQAAFSGAVRTPEDPLDTGDIVLLHLRQGDLFALQGEWAAAENEFQAAVDAGGGIPALRKLAQAQMQRREVANVKTTIKELRRLGARNEDLLFLEVIVALRTGELVQAAEMLTKAEDSPQKHYGAALLAIVQEKNDVAKQELQAVLNGWDPALRAYARTLQGAYDEAALFPESPPQHLTTLLARALAQVQECELALPLVGQVVRAQDDYRDAWTVQGYCELTTERPEEALASFQKAYALDPEKPEIQYFLGRTAMVLKQWKNASTFLQYAIANGFEPKKEARRKLADAAERAGDPALALEQLRFLIAEPDADISTFEKTVTLALAQGKRDDAYQFAQAAVAKWPESEKARELLRFASVESEQAGSR